jgi:hypothetical protein
MHDRHFDTLIQHAADAVSRRRSFLAVTGAAVAASTLGPAATRAGKDAKKAKKRAEKKCKRQIDQCRDFFSEDCASDPDCPEEVLEHLLECCGRFRDCRAGEALDCLFTPFET